MKDYTAILIKGGTVEGIISTLDPESNYRDIWWIGEHYSTMKKLEEIGLRLMSK